VNPNFQVDNNNKSSSPKQLSNETIENTHDQQINNDYNNQTDIDPDTKYLMMLHQQIIPSQNLVSQIEIFLR